MLFLLCGRLWARLPGWPPAQIFLWLLRGVAGSLPIVALELGLAMAIRSFAVPVLLGLAGGVSGMLIASKGGTPGRAVLAVFADADGHELQQSGGCAGPAARPFSGPPALCGPP